MPGKVNVYKSKEILEIESFYGDLLFKFHPGRSIHTYLKKLASRMWSGIKEHNSVVQYEIKNYHPAYLGGDGDSFFSNPLKKEDARLTLAREYGFRKWSEVKKKKKSSFDIGFETAVECLLNGNLVELKKLLKEDPKLVYKQSKFGHRATLLHYTASNGIELWRQRVPGNLPEITKCLLENGADKNAKMNVYRGEFDTLALLESSAHPFDAGVGEEMLRVLGG